jgi:ATP-dependent Clp protease ATP-binding subunit ClpA
VLESDRREGETFASLLGRISKADWYEATAREIPFSSAAKRVLQFGASESDALEHRDIRPAHLLLGLLREEGTEAWRTLNAAGMTLKEVRQALTQEGEGGAEAIAAE